VSGTRVYVPSTFTLLQDVVQGGGVGPVPLRAHAVTAALREAYAEGSDEEWEYVASTAAAQTALALLVQGDVPRRVVLAVDAETVRQVDDPDPTVVEVDDPVPLRRVAAVLVDGEDAVDDVAAAVAALADAGRGEAEVDAVVERCLDHDLAWYASQEIPDLLDFADGPE
jgi:creatinine amidohydrolase/Fe(II)-dependent formamide hydrolase-like protein